MSYMKIIFFSYYLSLIIIFILWSICNLRKLWVIYYSYKTSYNTFRRLVYDINIKISLLLYKLFKIVNL